MKTRKMWSALALVSLLLLCATPVFAQAPAQDDTFKSLVGAGVAYNQTSTPQFTGNLFYSFRVSQGTYSFTAIDIVPGISQVNGAKSLSVATAVTTGAAQHLRDFGKVRIYVLGTIGTSAGGSGAGLAWSAGGFALYPIGSKGWFAALNIRTLKANASQPPGVTPFNGILGATIGYGIK